YILSLINFVACLVMKTDRPLFDRLGGLPFCGRPPCLFLSLHPAPLGKRFFHRKLPLLYLVESHTVSYALLLPVFPHYNRIRLISQPYSHNSFSLGMVVWKKTERGTIMGIADMVRTRIIALCRERDITVNRMCELAAVPQSTVNNFLNRKTHNLGIITLKKLTDGLGLSITEFFDTEAFRALDQEIH
ncbi:helix-turn-helix transcriptional regulator, partial [Oscillibacter sp. CU971]|uniref:helix-turn-helix domain-containing protein n=3 Tax=Oscillibacter TaxID=459786 RepID=UPI001FAFBF12